MSQIAEIGSADDAALWAYANMRAKNELCAADALQVEEAFESRLAALRNSTDGIALAGHGADHDVRFATRTAAEPASGAGNGVPRIESRKPTASVAKTTRRLTMHAKLMGAIDKAVLSFPEPRRIRDHEHVRFVAKQPCLVCGRIPCDPHHLRFTQTRALGRKVSDEFTVPLCRGHHREIHRCGDETQWWRKLGIDATTAARALWLETHPLSSPVKAVD